MDAITLTRVMKELMRLLQNGRNYDYETVESQVAKLKKELGPWFIENYQLYVGS